MKGLEARDDEADLHLLLAQTERAGAQRRAVMLHIDRLPAALSKPHHLQLAREALSCLASADRARTFELARGRKVIVWRGSCDEALAQARTSLQLLLSGQPEGKSPSLGELLTLYDLPEQNSGLLDEIAYTDAPLGSEMPERKLDLMQLSRLEASLAQADLAAFARWQPVMKLDSKAPTTAWDEHFFSAQDIAASLCPGVGVRADPWLFARLTRTLDRRMLALLSTPQKLVGARRFAIHLNIETILASEFLAFDAALPLALRGDVILNLNLTDILSDPGGFLFASRFAQARGYRLSLCGVAAANLDCILLSAMAVDFVEVDFSSDLRMEKGVSGRRLPPTTNLIASGLDRPSQVRLAIACGITFGKGAALRGFR